VFVFVGMECRAGRHLLQSARPRLIQHQNKFAVGRRSVVITWHWIGLQFVSISNALVTCSLVALSRSLGERILHGLYMNPKVYYRVYKNPPLVPILIQMHPVHTFPPFSPNIQSSIILSSTPSFFELSPTLTFSNKTTVWISRLSPHARQVMLLKCIFLIQRSGLMQNYSLKTIYCLAYFLQHNWSETWLSWPWGPRLARSARFLRKLVQGFVNWDSGDRLLF
jgi:hypothetical protein